MYKPLLPSFSISVGRHYEKNIHRANALKSLLFFGCLCDAIREGIDANGWQVYIGAKNRAMRLNVGEIQCFLGIGQSTARTLSSQGQYAEAEAMHREVWQLRETVLGRDHPSTLTGMNNLAGALRQGKHDEAE